MVIQITKNKYICFAYKNLNRNYVKLCSFVWLLDCKW